MVSGELRLTGALWGWMNGINFETLGYGVVALLVLPWAVSAAYYRYRGYDKIPLSGTGRRT